MVSAQKPKSINITDFTANKLLEIREIPRSFLRGPWVTRYTTLLRNPDPATPARVGADYSPISVLICFGFHDTGKHSGFLWLNNSGNPVGYGEVHATSELAWNEAIQTLDGYIHLEDPRRSIYFIVRDHDTIEWLINDTDNPQFRILASGTANRVSQVIYPSFLNSRWITNYSSYNRVINISDPIQIGKDFSPESTLACFRFGEHRRIQGWFRRNKQGDLPIDGPSTIEGSYVLAWNQTHHVYEGEIQLGFPDNSHIDTLRFIMRDADTIDWVLLKTNDDEWSGKVASGTMKRLLPV